MTQTRIQKDLNDTAELAGNPIEPGWASEEFAAIDFNDRRLDARFVRVAEALSALPTAPINQASDDWADTKAAYRLFDNEKVKPSEIFAVHQRRTAERARAHLRILNVQDTTYLNYSHHPLTRGLGSIGRAGKKELKGLIAHVSLAMTTQGLPLGLLGLDIQARKEREFSHSERKSIPLKEKESRKWLDAMHAANRIVAPEVRVVHVCDREADIFEFMTEASEKDAEFLIRAAQDRRVDGADEICGLWESMEARPVAGHRDIQIAARDKQPARTARVAVRYAEMRLLRPKHERVRKDLESLDVHVVMVSEVSPPEGVAPVEWLLLTNVAVGSFKDAVERIDWYRLRWDIELYFKVLKSGCRVEDCRLETSERLLRYLALFGVIAWRLFWMTKINRLEPDAACTAVLADHEWKALYCRIHRTKNFPEQAPTVREAVRWIARLGGFLGRRRDGEPGIIVIWRGWQRLTEIATTWLIMMES